jgi:hypothetical protein
LHARCLCQSTVLLYHRIDTGGLVVLTAVYSGVGTTGKKEGAAAAWPIGCFARLSIVIGHHHPILILSPRIGTTRQSENGRQDNSAKLHGDKLFVVLLVAGGDGLGGVIGGWRGIKTLNRCLLVSVSSYGNETHSILILRQIPSCYRFR